MHAGNQMQSDMGDRFVACFVAAADDTDLPSDPDFRAVLRRYMEWAVAQMYRFNDVDATAVPDRLAVPRWSWEGPIGEAARI